MSFGVAPGAHLAHQRARALMAITAALVLSLCPSYSVEVLQVFLPGRFPFLTDLLSNTAGAG